MAKLIVGIVLLFFLGLLVMAGSRQEQKTATLVKIPDTIREVVVSGEKFAYVFSISDPGRTKLVSNFEDKLSSAELTQNNHCASGINGSFYDENREPLGWWKSEGVTRKKPTHNNLLNGYIGLRENNTMWINKNPPDSEVVWGMQSGPVLITDGKQEKLTLAADKQARRSVGGTTALGKFVAMSIFRRDSRFDGPLLSLLPAVVGSISDKEGWQIMDAVNLDGGAASAFYSANELVPEMVVVGSWICIY